MTINFFNFESDLNLHEVFTEQLKPHIDKLKRNCPSLSDEGFLDSGINWIIAENKNFRAFLQYSATALDRPYGKSGLSLFYSLDERGIRIWCASKARAYNRIYCRGGVSAVYRATNVSRPRIYHGLKEIESDDKLSKDRIRKAGGGRKKLTEKQGTILKDLESLLEPGSRGDLESSLRWTCKSTYNLRDALIAQGYNISQPKVGELL